MISVSLGFRMAPDKLRRLSEGYCMRLVKKANWVLCYLPVPKMV